MSPKVPEDIENKIREILSKMSGLNPKEISLNAHFAKELGMDSIQGIELIVTLKKVFGVDIDDMKLPELITVNAVCNEVLRLLHEQSSE